MTVAIITERISASLAAGKLTAKPENAQVALLTMADLLQPFDQIFPGMRVDEVDRRKIFAWGGLRKPQLAPQFRRSSRPLQVPRQLVAPTKIVSPGLFDSVRAIWSWYQQQGIAVEALQTKPFSDKELENFLYPLCRRAEQFYPLSIPLDNLFWDDDLLDLPGVHLMLPHYSAEEEYAGVIEAFLTGAAGVEWLMCHYYGLDHFLTLPPEDRELIDQYGFGNLCRCYHSSNVDRSYDLQKLENFSENFFGPVWKKYPKHQQLEPPMISAEAGMDADVMIDKPEDIDFCFAYAQAFYEMTDQMPDPPSFEENDLGITETFTHELCEIWRADHKLPSVPWTSPIAKEITL